MPKGVYERTDEMRRNMSAAHKDQKPSQKQRETVRTMLLGQEGEKNRAWKGGCYRTWHNKAWELFGLDKCEVCGITNEEHKEETGQRLSMHCEGHRYKNLERIFWTTACQLGCHQTLERL